MIYKLSTALRRSLSLLAGKEGIQDVRNSLCKIEGGPKVIKKSIKVAIIGKPNAGKSTLINRMMGMNICAASVKPQTTLEYQRVFNVKDDTEIVLIDTPGILSAKLMKRFHLSKEADVYMIPPIRDVDLVGVLIDASDKYSKYVIPSLVKKFMATFQRKTEMILILNKVDLVKDKYILLKMVDKMCDDLKSNKNTNLSKRIFTRIFMISALKNDGVDDLVQYLRSIAHEKENHTSSERLSSHSDLKIVKQRIRASLLEYFKNNIPYECSCHVDYFQENTLGRVNIKANIICPNSSAFKKISDEIVLEKIALECEEDLQKIFSKPVFLGLRATEKRKINKTC